MRFTAEFSVCHVISSNDETLLFACSFSVDFLQTLLQLRWESVEAAFATWLQINVVEFGLLMQFRVTEGTSKVINTPCFVKCCEDISPNDLIANEAQVTKQLMVMCFTISQSLLLVMPLSQERFFTLRTYKVFHMPVFSHRLDDPLLNRSMTGTTDRDPHLVMTGKTVQLFLHFTSFGRQFNATGIAVEVVGMVRLALLTKGATSQSFSRFSFERGKREAAVDK